MIHQFRRLLPWIVIAGLASPVAGSASPVAFDNLTTTIFINEIHYDNTGTDAGETIEVAGPAGVDLTGWSIVLYNGSGGAVYDTDALSGVIADQSGGYGTVTLAYPSNGIQNGSPDGIALVDASSTVIQFLSYEGAFTAVGGPANGMASTNIGVSETGSEPLGQSLQLAGAGTEYGDFSWSAAAAHTFGGPNTGQTFGAVNEPVVASCGGPLSTPQGTAASQAVSASDVDGTVVDVAITSVDPSPAPGSISLSSLTPAGGIGGTATAQVDVDAAVPAGTYTVLLTATNDDSTPQTGTCSLTVSVVPENQPVIASCGGPATTFEGIAASYPVSASDADGTVTDISITSIDPPPAAGSITPSGFSPAGGDGGTAVAQVDVDAAVPPGTYAVLLTATNNDATPQTGTCILTVTVQDILPIGAVQGSVGDGDNGATHRSPFAPPSGNGAGTTQVTVQGVIYQRTLARTSSGANQNGFFLQNTATTADSDPNSSDGVFVFMGGFTSLIGGYVPQVGDEVIIRSRVTEFFSLTELTSATALLVVRRGVDIEAEIGSFDANPPDSLPDAQRYWERREGMRARIVPGSVVLNGRNVFPSTMDGEVWLVHPDHEIASRSGFEGRSFRDPHPLDNDPALFDDGNGYRIVLGSLGVKATSGNNNTLIAPAGTFDVVVNSPMGGVYFSFNKYQIQVGQDLDLSGGPDPFDNAPPAAFDRTLGYSVATFNVENLYDFRDDPFDGCDFTGNAGCPGVNPPFDYVPASDAVYQERLDQIASQIVDGLRSPDLILVQEAEDQDLCTGGAGGFNCGASDNADGRPDTLQELAQAIAELGGPVYEAVYDRDGADDRGIVSGFLFRTDRVELLPASADDPVLGAAPTVVYRDTGEPYNTDVQNPKVLNADLPEDVDTSTGTDGSLVFTRAPQVGLFRIWRDGIGTSVFSDVYALSNHFSSTPNARVGQRTEQAAYNAAIVAALQAAEDDALVIVGGDLNVYPRPDDPFAPGHPLYPSDQLGPLYDQGLINLYDSLVGSNPVSAYSYVFEGQAQTLDQIFLTASLLAEFVEMRVAHINSDWPADHDDGPRGTSDHDPQVARQSLLPTLDRLDDLLTYYIEAGAITGNNTAQILQDRLARARDFMEQGKTNAYLAQLQAFADQVEDFTPQFITPEAGQALATEAELLRSLGG
ncbi:MAG: hypothetical protein WD040_07520 [Anaerolineales bacterium]